MIAFLYDREQTTPFTKPVFLERLAIASASDPVRSRLFEGSLLISTMAWCLVGASRSNAGEHSIRQSDSATSRTLAGDVVECLRARPHTVHPERLLELLLMHRVDCIGLGTCTFELAEGLDTALRSDPAYLGYVYPDIGNPIQYELFVQLLSSRTQIAGDEVIEAWPEEMSLPQDFPLLKRRAVLEWDFPGFADPVPPREPLSSDGARSQQRYDAAKARRPHLLRERVARAALEALDSFQLSEPPNEPRGSRTSPLAVVRLEIDPQDLRKKLTDYVLNSAHEIGRHKAKVFATKLGLTAAQWLSLAAQIAANVGNAEVYRVVQSEHGLLFRARMNVTGAEGRTATIETGWIVRDGAINLTTVLVAHEKRQRPEGRPPPFRIDGLQGNTFHEEAYRRAHAAGVAAYDSTMPTPIVISVDGDTHITSECGTAFVAVKDARTGFARWLLRSGHGTKAKGSGARVFAPRSTQSFEKAQAYAQAFAQVLRENDIPCEIVTVDD